MTTPESRQAAARRAARTRAQRSSLGIYKDHRTAAQVAAAQVERGVATLDDQLGPSFRTFGPRAKALVDETGRHYRQVEGTTFAFVLPSGGKAGPPQPGETLQLTSPAGEKWVGRVQEVGMSAKRRCSGMAVIERE
jgi:hypothetical protein